MELVLEFLFEYGLFLAKVVTGVLALVIVVSIVVGLSQKSRHSLTRFPLEVARRRCAGQTIVQ